LRPGCAKPIDRELCCAAVCALTCLWPAV
jgi:hypothetical protein